jgi:hypothetical protein
MNINLKLEIRFVECEGTDLLNASGNATKMRDFYINF